MGSPADLIAQVCAAQARNSTISSEELQACGRALARHARSRDLCVMAADAPGERLIGAALGVAGKIRLADRSRRLDGQAVLLVSGQIAGSAHVAQQARLARSLGAVSVEVIVLDGWSHPIDGCDRVTPLVLAQPSSLRHALAAI